MADAPLPPVSQNPYNDEEYRRQREASLKIISKSNIFSAISRNAGTINFALATSAVAAIMAGVVHIPVWGTLALIGGAIAAAAVNAYFAYKDEEMSKTTNLGYSEERQRADARVQGTEMANALKETLGQELKEVRQENCQTQAAVAQMQQHMLTWQEREQARPPESKALH